METLLRVKLWDRRRLAHTHLWESEGMHVLLSSVYVLVLYPFLFT